MEDATVSISGGAVLPVPNAPQTWGSFQLIEKVGQGSFGEVYRAWDSKLHREVAVKLLLPTKSEQDAEDKAILREARLMARVRHPNIVAVHGVDRCEGRVGFWSDFVHGETLSQLLARQGPFSPREAALVGIELCRALSAVHAAGLLHRDIKPRNAMREEGGRILLMDFGLTRESSAETRFGGTKHYMAPELLAGESATVRTDIYALGVLLYQLVTGKFPLDRQEISSGGETAISYQRRQLLDVRTDLSEAFAGVVERAIHTDPLVRFASAGQMLAALSDTMGTGSTLETSAAPQVKKRLLSAKWLVLPATVAIAGAFLFVPSIHDRLFKASTLPAGVSEDAYEQYQKADKLLSRYDKPGNLEAAAALFKKLSTNDPHFALASAGLGRAAYLSYISSGDAAFIAKTKEACRDALRSSNLASAHVTLGMLYTVLGENDIAAQEIEQALTLEKRSAEVNAAMAELYAKQGRLKEVEPAFQKAIDLAPNDWRWPNRLGLYYDSQGRFPEALAQFQRAKALTPDNPRPYNNLGMVYMKQGKLADAERELKASITMAPRPKPMLNYGAVLIYEGKYSDAAALLQRATALFPADYRAWSNLGAAYEWSSSEPTRSTRAFQKAVELAEKARGADPNNPALLADLASCYAYLKQSDRSLPLIRRALALAPDNPEVHLRAGEAYELSGLRKEALRSIHKALQLGIGRIDVEKNPDFANLRNDKRFLGQNPDLMNTFRGQRDGEY